MRIAVTIEKGMIDELLDETKAKNKASLDQSPETWLKAGKLSRELKIRGKTIPLLNCYVAVIAKENACAVITLDDHFKEIQRVMPLALV